MTKQAKMLVVKFGTHEEALRFAEEVGGVVERHNLWAVTVGDGKKVRELSEFAVSIEDATTKED